MGASALLEIGQALAAWLEGTTRWATRWVVAADALRGGRGPELEIRVPFANIREHWAMLDAPWELLAMDDPLERGYRPTHLATWSRPLVVYRRLVRVDEAAGRRVGVGSEDVPAAPAGPAANRASLEGAQARRALTVVRPRHGLTVLFMAAAPDAQVVLDHEAEERGILDATRQLPLDLLVEETGTAAELGKRWMARTGSVDVHGEAAPVQVVHLSCHGRLGRSPTESPVLLLEDELGRPMPTTAKELRGAFGGDAAPSLVVLSACLSAAGRGQEGAGRGQEGAGRGQEGQVGAAEAGRASCAAAGVVAAAALRGGAEPVEPMVLELLRSWAPAVIGFADWVADCEASCFAALLYRELAEGQSIETAVAWARHQMLTGRLRRPMPSPLVTMTIGRRPPGADPVNPSDDSKSAPAASTIEQLLARVAERGSRHWHLPRLMLRTDGGGALASPRAARRVSRRLPQAFLAGEARTACLAGEARTACLAGERRMLVAGPERFVGRRRELQEAVRVLSAIEVPMASSALEPQVAPSAIALPVAPSAIALPVAPSAIAPRLASSALPMRGVLIHGGARLGKSSLAARVAQRMGQHRAVVIDDCSVQGVLEAVRAALGPETPVGWPASAHSRPSGRRLCETPRELEQALRTLGTGSGPAAELARPLLWIVDDFERVLLADEGGHPRGRHRVESSALPVLRALLRALATAPATQSRLLVTSRYAFTLPDSDGNDLSAMLWPLSLPAMTEHEARKQANALGLTVAPASLGEACVRLSLRNPGLLAVLLALAVDDKSSCVEALEQMERFLHEGDVPRHETLREFFEQVGAPSLLGLLSECEQRLLRASMMFAVPVPRAAIPRLCEALALPRGVDGQRLVDLGLWEQHRDYLDRELPAVMASAQVRPWVASKAAPGGPLSQQERQLVARAVLPVVAAAWATVVGQGGSPVSHQLFELARATGDSAWMARMGWAGLDWVIRASGGGRPF